MNSAGTPIAINMNTELNNYSESHNEVSKMKETANNVTEAPATTVAALTESNTEATSSVATTNNAVALVVAIITGKLKWVSNIQKDACLLIAILRSDETETDAFGNKLLVGIKLTRGLSARFQAAYGEIIFLGDDISVKIRTEDLAADIAEGKGRRNNPYFIGQELNY